MFAIFYALFRSNPIHETINCCKEREGGSIANFKQNAFAMVTPPRRNNIQVPELTGATLGNSPVGVKYQHYPEQVQIFQNQRNSPAGEPREVQEPLTDFEKKD